MCVLYTVDDCVTSLKGVAVWHYAAVGVLQVLHCYLTYLNTNKCSLARVNTFTNLPQELSVYHTTPADS
jgi:hypothetical protein